MVTAMAVVLIAGALAPIALRVHRRDVDFVDETGSGAVRDQVAPCSLIVREDVLGVKFEETLASKVLGGKRLRLYTWCRHKVP